MTLETDGLVIAEQSVGESDRLATILTRDEGVVRAFARQAKKVGSAKASATQLFCYSRLTLYKGREKYVIDDARPVELFFDLRRDVERLALAQYFCELARTLAPQEAPAGDFLRLVLNALHFLSKGKKPPLLLKAVVEMRMLELSGYMPDLVGCRECGSYEADPMLFFRARGRSAAPPAPRSSPSARWRSRPACSRRCDTRSTPISRSCSPFPSGRRVLRPSPP